jgi:hypothetical protein
MSLAFGEARVIWLPMHLSVAAIGWVRAVSRFDLRCVAVLVRDDIFDVLALLQTSSSQLEQPVDVAGASEVTTAVNEPHNCCDQADQGDNADGVVLQLASDSFDNHLEVRAMLSAVTGSAGGNKKNTVVKTAKSSAMMLIGKPRKPKLKRRGGKPGGYVTVR